MLTHLHQAQAQGPSAAEIHNFIAASLTPPTAGPAQPLKPPRKSELAKANAKAEFEAQWQGQIPVARWIIDLGPLEAQPASDSLSTSVPAKRPTSTETNGKTPKKARLANGTTSSRISTVFDVSSLEQVQRITVLAAKRERHTTREGGSVWGSEPGRFDVRFRNQPVTGTPTETEDLEIKTNFDQQDHLRFVDLLAIQNVDIHCRARCIAYLGVDSSSIDGTRRTTLVIDFCWKNSRQLEDSLARSSPVKEHLRAAARLLAYIYPTLVSDKSTTSDFTPRSFYDSVHVPAFNPKDAKEELVVPGLQTGLFPFQKRSVMWMMQRESSVRNPPQRTPTNGFEAVSDADGRHYYFNPWLQIATNHDNVAQDTVGSLKGGILAEEMGLGKTVELISLIQLHKRGEADLGLRNGLHRCAATLVVAPSAIIAQWRSEITTHCPSLAVLQYQGRSMYGPKRTQLSDEAFTESLMSYDIVLVDYYVLSKEIWAAMEPPQRDRRSERVYERRRSVLTQIDWWRVILDEAQLIDSGTTKAAEVARLLPRQHAWAVSGTPLKKDAIDLFGLLRFLKLEPYALSKGLFEDLVGLHPSIFRKLIGSIVLRHSKDQVRGDLLLPPQKRIVINVPFTAIEEQNYNQLFEEMTSECGLAADGSPVDDTWDPDDGHMIAKMREWLAKLRKICLHAEVGSKRKRALGGRDGPLRTVNEVLAVMVETNEANLRTEERSRLQSMLRRGQIYEHAKQPCEAKQVWEAVLDDVVKMVAIDRDALASELSRVETANGVLHSEGQEDETTASVSRIRNRLRTSLELQHSAVFFIANANFQIKTDTTLTPQDSASERFRELEAAETAGYEEAKALRRELLSSSAENAGNFMSRVRTRAKTNGFVKVKGFKDLPLTGGLETRKHVDHLEDLLDCLNQQAEFLDDLRQKLAKAVLLPLVDQEETELTGEEYETSTKEEDQIHAYMEALRLLIADRAQVVTGQRNLNVRREATRLYNEAVSGEGHAPDLMKDLLRQVNQMRMAESRDGNVEFWLRGTVQQLLHLRGTLDARSGRASELAIIDSILHNLKPESDAALKTVLALDKELEMFSDTVNSRVEYYRQLQVISDLVAPFEEELTEAQRASRMSKMQHDEQTHQVKASRLRGRATFLGHLKASSNTNEPVTERTCVICTDSFDNGVLTSCGHVYCKDCITLWWSQHRSCPQCKQSLAKTDLHPITYKAASITVQEDSSHHQSSKTVTEDNSAPSKTRSIYDRIDETTLQEITAIDLSRSYGTKIDMLARHILWLREKEPGAKSVVFSQFGEFFDILTEAFDRFRIGWSSLGDFGATRYGGIYGVERFKKDRDVEVLLLHAQSQAAGLNLINATHVFLSEPLLNTAIELQVIARVHRIGQHSPTTVWMYLIDNTVEKAIYDISVERRLAHAHISPVKDRSKSSAKRSAPEQAEDYDFQAAVEASDSKEIGAPADNMLAKGRSGGEQVAKDDLWPCLFKYRPEIQSKLSEETQQATITFLAGEAADSRRQDVTLRPSNAPDA